MTEHTAEIEIQSKATKKNIIIDSQILTALMGCPRLCDFRFNLNLVSINGKSNSLECGSIVHTFLEFYYGAQIIGKDRIQAFPIGIAAAELYIKGCPYCTDFVKSIEHPKPICGHKANQFPGVKNTPKEPDPNDALRKNYTGWHFVLDTCQQYFDFYKNDHWVSLEAEVTKGKILYEDDEIRVMWKAKIDWVADTNQGIYPIDHKTMKQNRDTLSLNNQFIGQCLVSDTRNVIINKVGFQKSLKPSEKFIRTPVSYSAPRLIEWQSEILPYYCKLLLMYMESGYFPPQFNNCRGPYGDCMFVHICESDTNMREDEMKRLFVVGPGWDIGNEID